MRRVLTILVTVTTIMTLTAGPASAGRGDRAPSERAQAEKIPVCHYDADTDAFHLINVNGNAFAAHIAHGDAAPGEAVSGADGAGFDEWCDVVSAATKIVEGSFSGNGLVDSFTVFEGPGGAISGSMLYSFGSHVIKGTVIDVCLDPTAGDASVWGPAVSTRDGNGYLILTIVVQPDDTLKTRAKFEKLEYDGAARFDKQCSTSLVFAPGTGTLTFW